MSSATTTTQLPLLKRLWGNSVAEPLHKRSKFFSMMAKDTNFGGEGRYVIVTIAPTSGGGANFQDALEAQGASQEKRFFVPHRKEYQIFSIQGDLIARSKGDKNAVLDALKQQANMARYAFARAIAARIWGNQGGSLGRLSASTTLTTANLILRNRGDFVRFEPGQYVQFASDDGSAASPAGLRDSGKALQILSIDTETGTLVLSGLLNTIAGITVNDYVFRKGDYAVAMSGIPGWNPTVKPTAGDSFMGLDRSVGHVQRLAGTIVNGSGGPKEDTLIDAMAEGQLAGIDDTMSVFCHPLDFKDLVKELSTKRVIDIKPDKAPVGFRAVETDGPLGNVNIISEVDVPKGNFWIQPMSELTMRTAGDCPMMLNEDGVGRLLRSATDDAYQGRMGAYGNVFHENPGHAVVGIW